MQSEMDDASDSNHNTSKHRGVISLKSSILPPKSFTHVDDGLHDPDFWLDPAFSLPKNVTKEMIVEQIKSNLLRFDLLLPDDLSPNEHVFLFS